ncbi:FGGY-family carbohydrate kinase (plasmid) [Chimaeribacter arupi]|uniref:FGGY-family carbohydrate kinase n=1 Tax=Chimaeribacter arupi TaxID=2060066 RepID=UPI002711FFE9|nr:FGGY-family carbohydrate kinase [Chimaeribacter arupi]WKZ94867.1 FGGY-family carbohydrate kinase [Chimaeribacter arupi]
MAQDYFLGVDVGSASVRAGVYDAQGTRLAFAVEPITQFRPGGERVEHASSEIWQQVCAVVNTALDKAGIDRRAVRSLGFDATCSLVAVDAAGHGVAVSPEGNAAHDTIMWMDHRAGAEAACINQTGDEALQYVGGEVSLEMQLPKVLWLKTHLPERYRQVHRFFDLADFLVWKATGQDAASLCTLTCKWNYLAHEQRFSESLLAAVGLGDLPEKLPATVLEVGARAGTLTPQAADALGLSPQVVVAAGMIDAHAGGLALLGTQPDATLALISGTSNCHMLANREKVMTPGVWGPYWSAMLPGWWLTEGGQSAAGALVDWTLHQQGGSVHLTEQAAAQQCHPVELVNRWVAQLEQREPFPTRHLHVLADHHGNRSPRAQPDARGSVSGLTLERGEPALARLYLATLQAIAYGTRHIMEVMAASGHRVTRLVMCGGATRNPLWLREYADITGCDIQLVSDDDPVTLGAAITGAAAGGYWPGITAACAAMVRPDRVIAANVTKKAFHDQKYRAYLAMYDQQQALNTLMR